MAETEGDKILDDPQTGERRERHCLPVVGFFQQSREVRLNNTTLPLQARELRRSVDEHRRVADGK